jgi:MerR family transcriptional regulator, thiopeptide resistance regulator
MLTVTRLARSCGLSRSTVLYYESIGLLKPAPRSAGNYRQYGTRELDRLRQICVYRDAGLKLQDIRTIMSRPANDAASVLKRRVTELNSEIEKLREHQRSILRLLGAGKLFGAKQMINKEKWVQVMKAAGFSEEAMRRWHAEFEKAAPAEHQEFLEFLHIPVQEIETIRDWSRKAGTA